MPFQNPNQWVRAIKGKKLGFRYEPGSLMRSNGVESEYFSLDDNWQQMRRDAIKVAVSKFGSDTIAPYQLEVSNTKPEGVA